NGCSASDEVDVLIYTLPVVDLGVDQFVCGGTVTLDAGSASAYEWSDASTSQTLVVTTSGTYGVTVTDANGCTATDDAVIGIATVPTVNLGADISQCGGSVTLDAGSASTYEWSDASTGQTLVASTSNNYAVTVTNNDGCTATDDIDVAILAVPVATLNLTTDAVCLDADPLTLGGGSPAGGTYSGAGVFNNVFTPSSAGNVLISYIVVNNDGCADTADATLTVFVCTGINQFISGTVVLFPNPSHNFVTLQATGIDGRMQVTICDVTGKVVEQWSGNSQASGYNHTFDVSSYSYGTYVVNVKTDNGTATYNLVVQ
ncbi:MAG TPA: T9SS type A sorting domain-containing protein, partial [Chitinophagales bacterium]|nr:T9SS type A sorting domain-containing protein [Chitinophagales bacterium]